MAKHAKFSIPMPTVRTRRAYFDCKFGQLHVRTAFPATGGFDEGVTLMSNIVDHDLDDLRIGQRVKLVFKESASGQPIAMFTPAQKPRGFARRILIGSGSGFD